MGTSFIPYANHNIIEGYSMTSSFTEHPGLDIIGDKYANYLSRLVSGGAIPNQHAIGKAMANLQSYVSQERAAELAFLAEVGGLLGLQIADDPSGWKLLIEAFNQVFNVEAVLERNIFKLKELQSKNNKGKVDDITRHLQDTYLPKAIHKVLPIKSLSQITNNFTYKIMQDAVQMMFAATDNLSTENDENKIIQCYKEMWNALEGLSHKNSLFVNLTNLFDLQGYLTKNMKELNEANTYSAQPKITSKQSNSAGQVLEEIEAAVLGQMAKLGTIGVSSGDMKLNMKFSATGSTLQKADTFGIMMQEGIIDISGMTKGPKKKNDSYRLRSLERIENILEKIGSKKAQVIFISDKNYQIGNNSFHAKHGGFKAENPTLSSLSLYGAQFHIPNISGMIEYLASAGPGMIVEDIDMCLEVIKISIGNFLFDDLQITGPTNSGANRVHLLNLGGSYMPASVYLQATLQGLQGLNGLTADDMVQVQFEPNGQAGSSTLAEWNRFHTERLKSHLSIHFLGGYTKFMNQIFNQ